MTDEKDMAKQLKYRAGDVVTLKVATSGRNGALSLTLVRAILLMISCCISCSRRKRSMLAMKLKSICIKIRMAV